MLNRVIASSLLLVHIFVWSALILAIVLYGVAIIALVQIIQDIFQLLGAGESIYIHATVGSLKIIDLLLIAAGFQIIAFGVYQICIDRAFEHPAVADVKNFGDLKSVIAKIVVIILIINFLENIVETGPGEHILGYGLAIAAVILAASWSGYPGISKKD